MMIDLIGAGSLGLLYGGKLAASGAKVRVWCRSAEQAQDLREKGIKILYVDGGTEARAAAGDFDVGVLEDFAFSWQRQPGDYILLMTKQKDVLEVCSRIAAHLEPDKLHPSMLPGLVCFQNGYGHMDRVAGILPGWPLYAGVTTEGAKRISPSEVMHAGAGATWVGATEKHHAHGNEASKLEPLVKMLQKAGFSTVLANDIDSRIFRKLLINAVINPLTALWSIPNGELLATKQRIGMMRMLLDEALRVYDACGIPWDQDIWDQIVEVCTSTSGNTSSMLKDVQAGMPTEIEWINGSIAALAKSSGLRAEAHELVTGLIQGLMIREE